MNVTAINTTGGYVSPGQLQGISLPIKGQDASKPKVVILGAGPGGLIRAIHSLAKGNPTLVLERRSENSSGRDNIVNLTGQSLDELKRVGVYQMLLNKGLMYSERYGRINVRTGDLEACLREVITLIEESPTIQYNSEVTGIQGDAELIVKTDDAATKVIQDVGLLVVAEGANSHTANNILKVKSKELLPPIPMYGVIQKVDSTKITGPITLCIRIFEAIKHLLIGIYYHLKFFLFYILTCKVSSFEKMDITAVFISKTPGIECMGLGLSVKVRKKIQAFNDEIAQLKAENNQNFVEKVEAEKAAYLKDWCQMAGCWNNILKVGSYLLGKGFDELTSFATTFTMDKVQEIYVSVKRREGACGKIGRLPFLLTGDAYSTVDPTTGRGCRSAIETVSLFNHVLKHLESALLDSALEDFSEKMVLEYTSLCEHSKRLRAQVYR